ncbi:proteasome-interacting protein cic1 [Cladophialophora chaetospira]|uniref:Proteasome-interacting protein cic1 n=1 Tax=Cladophialophora chaetospira TaxID=386627 RepID=A0AA38WXW8_9EURO|nr:proteasome-interacting protein cic1 [Cladophialophora chaetospira]
MAVATEKTTIVATKHPQETPYQLDPEHTLKASRALLQHIQTETKRIQQASSKKSLLNASTSDSDDDVTADAEAPIWLTLTTKQHIVDKNRLKPSKIHVPHSLNTSPDLRICLITTDPQRAVKNVVADPAFPEPLKSRIHRVIGLTKLKARYKTYEQLRELHSEHDVFLADDRIITRLPQTLGKVFYKGTTKRPIPIMIADTRKEKTEKSKKSKTDGASAPISPASLAKEIEKALDSVPVSLRPGTLVAVRVGLAAFKPEQLVENITTVVSRLIEKHVVKGWKNVRGVHIKGEQSFAVPLWLADDLWADSGDVLEAPEENGKLEEAEEQDEHGSKRKRNPATSKGPQAGSRKRARVDDGKNGKSTLDHEVAQERKRKLASQKAKVFGDTL